MKTQTLEKYELLLSQYFQQQQQPQQECKHHFIDNVCIHCAEETLGMINYEKRFDTKNTSKVYKSALNSIDASLKYDLRNLNLDDEILSSVIQMYKQVTKDNIQRSKLRKSIPCSCICISYMKFGLVHDKKYLLQYFGINENYSLGDKKVKLAIPETRQYYEGVPEHLKILVHKCKLNTEHYTEVLDMFNLLKGNCDSGKEYGPNFENRNPKTIGTVVFLINGIHWHPNNRFH